MKPDKILSLIGLATRAGKIASGEFCTEKEVKTGRAALVIVAEDASDNTKKKFKVFCEKFKVPIIENYRKEELGAILGREEINIIGILDKKIGDRLLELNIEESN